MTMRLVNRELCRVGPSTGLPTRTQQADLLQVAFHSHGDTSFPMLFPASARECFEFSWRAFDIADRYQTPIVVMSDLDLGMNIWVSDPLEYPDAPFDRGKVLTEEELKKVGSWGRYRDVDGDGIPYRTIPGTSPGGDLSYFTRGSGHDEEARYTESHEVYVRNLDRVARKVASVTAHLPDPVITGNADSDVALVAYGSSDHAVQEALAGGGHDLAYMRIRGYPFHDEVGEFLARRERIIVLDQNQQGQMAQLLRMTFPQVAARIESIRHYGGLPLSAEWVAGALGAVREKVTQP